MSKTKTFYHDEISSIMSVREFISNNKPGSNTPYHGNDVEIIEYVNDCAICKLPDGTESPIMVDELIEQELY